MGLPTQPVSISPAELAELNNQLSELRHSINNHLTLMVTALELIRRKPESAERLVANLIEVPARIRTDVTHFSEQFERTFKVGRE
jgi:NADH:ubiquinone oxidoreductase subunit E